MKASTRIGATAMIAFGLVSCASADDGDPATQESSMSESSTPGDTTSDPTSAPTTSGPATLPTSDLPLGDVDAAVVARSEVQDAIADAAQRWDISADAVTVAGHRYVTWSDGAMGCPEEGQVYTQALVAGEQLILESEGSYASYHAATDHGFNYCANPQSPSSSQAVDPDI